MKIFTLFLSLIILSCNAQKEVTEKETKQEDLVLKKTIEKEVIQNNITPKNGDNMEQKTQIEVLANESHGGYETSKYMVIKDQEALQGIYGKVNMMRRPGIPIPKIDWKNEMVIALFMGQKNSGGHSISVDKITSLNDDKVELLLKEVGPGEFTNYVICQPFYFCKVQRTDKEVIFKKVE